MRYMDIEEQVDADFTRARRRAFVRRMGARLRGGATSGQSAFINGHTLSVDGGWFSDGSWESLRRRKHGN